MLNISTPKQASYIHDFCNDFQNANPESRFVFGINEYAQRISEQIEIAGFIDDFASSTSFLNKPIIKSSDTPSNALVVSSLLGRPLTARRVLTDANIRHLDFFAFYEHSGLTFDPVRFWGGFKEDFNQNEDKYSDIGQRLVDEASRQLFNNIINFRLSGELAYLDDCKERQHEQYFEDFLNLKPEGEVFVDVGGFDGFTSREFIKRSPNYKSVYLFEPEKANITIAKQKLKNLANIFIIEKGLSNKKDIVRFSADGSISTITEDGGVEIHVDALDNIVDDDVSFIKMDIEGAESLAIEGAKQTILKHHPRLAICVYHKPTDLRAIPEQIFAIRDDYDIYLRHYTEGVVETVMFFMPKK